MGAPQQQPAKTPEEIGQVLASYAGMLAALETVARAGKVLGDYVGQAPVPAGWYFNKFKIDWGVLPWGKARQRALRLFFEVLGFDAYICLSTAQIYFSTAEDIKQLCAGFFSYLEQSVPQAWKSAVIPVWLTTPGPAPVVAETLSTFIATRGEHYEQAFASGPTGLLEWARILTRDVPGLVVDDATLLEVSLHMSAKRRTHTEEVSKLIRESLVGIPVESLDMPKPLPGESRKAYIARVTADLCVRFPRPDQNHFVERHARNSWMHWKRKTH